MQRFVIETLTLRDGMYEVQVWEGSSGEVLWRKLALGLDELEIARGEAWRKAREMETDPAWVQVGADREEEYLALRETVGSGTTTEDWYAAIKEGTGDN